MSASILDHVVVNVGFEMDAAQTCFTHAGFTLTPRGRHSLGSINHLAMFATDYLELIGLPVGDPVRRTEIAAEGVGLKGLVFKSHDVDETFAHLQALGMAGDAPRSFSRPVHIDGVEHEARFRTVAVRTGVFAAGRVYWCEHLTPQYVWHAPWMQHRNGVCRIREVAIVSDTPESEAQRYAKLLQRPLECTAGSGPQIELGGPKLRFMDSARYAGRYGAEASISSEQPTAFGGITLGTADLTGAREALQRQAGWSELLAQPRRFVAQATNFATVLEFEPE